MSRLFLLLCLASHIVCAHGFVTGTLIRTQEGFLPIEAIQPGDFVTTCDLGGYVCTEQAVVDVVQQSASHYLEVDLGKTSIGVSEDHRFFVPSKSDWLHLKDFEESTQLMNSAFEVVSVQSVRRIEKEVMLYDLSVEGHHNFYVSSAAILVHNMRKQPEHPFQTFYRFPTRYAGSLMFDGAVGLVLFWNALAWNFMPRIAPRATIASMGVFALGIIGGLNRVRRHLVKIDHSVDPYSENRH